MSSPSLPRAAPKHTNPTTLEKPPHPLPPCLKLKSSLLPPTTSKKPLIITIPYPSTSIPHTKIRHRSNSAPDEIPHTEIRHTGRANINGPTWRNPPRNGGKEGRKEGISNPLPPSTEQSTTTSTLCTPPPPGSVIPNPPHLQNPQRSPPPEKKLSPSPPLLPQIPAHAKHPRRTQLHCRMGETSPHH